MHLAIKEAQDRDELHSVRFGPLIQNGQRVSFKESRIDYMEKVDTLRSDEVYHHVAQIARREGVGGSTLLMGAGNCTMQFACTMYQQRKELRSICRTFAPGLQ